VSALKARLRRLPIFANTSIHALFEAKMPEKAHPEVSFLYRRNKKNGPTIYIVGPLNVC
jgi:hypothetical protein